MQNYKFEAIFIRRPISKKSEDWQDTAFQWKVLINNESFDYYTGAGWVDKFDRPKPPRLDDVLHSLVSDYEAMEMSFYEWCSNFGYDTDSMKAQQIYMACQSNGLKMRKAGINVNHERERLQDY
jgi:hypothetical protein